ncbi:hypothetical protein GF386_06480 [Candidatus Pacearchaeota archaeon]|nr:hypothetical protein [Candidatus Pacearchaeota archaeon]MBD3283738.1 hypothetical protein [Candidatus Pacearchaeota archaeon]
MKNKLLFIAIFVVFLIICSFIILSMEENNLYLVEGKNNIVINDSEPFYVKTLVELNQDIEVVSCKNEDYDFGYVNVFGGVGENFIIYPNKKYEIIANKDFNLVLPKS